jgi:hypothetical protein
MNYYIEDTISMTLTPSVLAPCSSQFVCTNVAALETTGSDLTLTYNSATYASTFYSNLACRDGTNIIIKMLEIPLSSYMYGCQFYYEHVKLSFMDV